jgi:hypothetical protein
MLFSSHIFLQMHSTKVDGNICRTQGTPLCRLNLDQLNESFVGGVLANPSLRLHRPITQANDRSKAVETEELQGPRNRRVTIAEATGISQESPSDLN